MQFLQLLTRHCSVYLLFLFSVTMSNAAIQSTRYRSLGIDLGYRYVAVRPSSGAYGNRMLIGQTLQIRNKGGRIFGIYGTRYWQKLFLNSGLYYSKILYTDSAEVIIPVSNHATTWYSINRTRYDCKLYSFDVPVIIGVYKVHKHLFFSVGAGGSLHIPFLLRRTGYYYNEDRDLGTFQGELRVRGRIGYIIKPGNLINSTITIHFFPDHAGYYESIGFSLTIGYSWIKAQSHEEG